MKVKRKKSMADISEQTARLLKRNHSVAREKRILSASDRYRYAILDYFHLAFGFTDRVYYKPLTRRVYAGY